MSEILCEYTEGLSTTVLIQVDASECAEKVLSGKIIYMTERVEESVSSL